MRLFFISILVCFSALPASAYSTEYFSLGVSLLQRDYFRLLNKDTGTKPPKPETNYPLIHLQYTFQAWDQTWTPELVWMPIEKKSADGGTKSSYLGLRVPIKNQLSMSSPNWYWVYGFSYFRYTIEGQGGTIMLDNLGSPQSFNLPSSKVTTQFLTLDAGLGYDWEQWSAGGTLLAEKILSSTKRSFSLMFDVKYNWR